MADFGVRFGQLARTARERAGLSANDAARRAFGDAARATWIEELEAGLHPAPRSDAVRALARALGIGPSDVAACLSGGGGGFEQALDERLSSLQPPPGPAERAALIEARVVDMLEIERRFAFYATQSPERAAMAEAALGFLRGGEAAKADARIAHEEARAQRDAAKAELRKERAEIARLFCDPRAAAAHFAAAAELLSGFAPEAAASLRDNASDRLAALLRMTGAGAEQIAALLRANASAWEALGRPDRRGATETRLAEILMIAADRAAPAARPALAGEAAKAASDAVARLNPEVDPVSWRAAQTARGAALLRLADQGDASSRAACLSESVTAFRAAAAVESSGDPRLRSGGPVAADSAFARALRGLARITPGDERARLIVEAETVSRRALARASGGERTGERVAAQHALAILLCEAAERQPAHVAAARFAEAAELCRAAREALTADLAQTAWARISRTLAEALAGRAAALGAGAGAPLAMEAAAVAAEAARAAPPEMLPPLEALHARTLELEGDLSPRDAVKRFTAARVIVRRHADMAPADRRQPFDTVLARLDRKIAARA